MGNLTKHRMAFVQYARREASNRMSLESERKDFFHYLLNAKDPETGEGFTTPELWAEAGLLIIAGSDTSSAAISSLLFYLSQNPRIVAKLYQELRTVFPSGNVEEIKSGSALNSCVYLRACVDEALRISPPIPGVMPRCIEAGGAVIDGHALPAGTNVGVGSYAIHHNPEYYPNPSVYQPERWLALPKSSSPSPSSSENDEEEQLTAVQAAFCAFSLGNRGCLGKGMAYLELLTTLARTVYLCEMKLESTDDGVKRSAYENMGYSGMEGEQKMRDVFICEKKGPLVQFKLREANA